MTTTQRDLHRGDWIVWKSYGGIVYGGLVLAVRQFKNHPDTDVWYYDVTLLQRSTVSEEVVKNPCIVRRRREVE